MIENRFIHINEKETLDNLKENIQDESIVFCKESGEIITHEENYGKAGWKTIGEPPVTGEHAKTLDVVFANKETGKLKIDGDWSVEKYPVDVWEPIGIVVIPGEHGVLKDGTGTKNQCGVMSIVPMSYNTPETGDTIENVVYWGGLDIDITGKSDGLGRYDSISNGLVNYQKVACDTKVSNTSTQLSDNSRGFLPRQSSIGRKPTWEGVSGYGYIPSPYNGSDYMSGGYNEAYGTTSFDSDEPNKNVLADFGGIVNTKILTDLATAVDWKTSSKIINKSGNGYYPAACCCARFHTTGTKAFKDCSIEELRNGTGFWYFPSAGELGYIIPRLADINNIINKLNAAYGIGVKFNTASYDCWTSSESSLTYTWVVSTERGYVRQEIKYYRNYVRSFLRL